MNVIPVKGSGFVDHREQYQELLQSPHKSFNCVDCHNPHKSARLDLKATCSTCHDKQVAAYKDSKHQKARVTCVNCHMTDLGETAVRRGPHRGDLSTHLFKINIDPNAKQFTDDKKFSQGYITLAYACLYCHADRNASWAAQYAKGIHKMGK